MMSLLDSNLYDITGGGEIFMNLVLALTGGVRELGIVLRPQQL